MKRILALCLAALMLVSLLAGCSKTGENEGIPAQAFSTGAELILPLEAELNNGDQVSYGGHQFETKKKLDKMVSLLTKENEGLEATIYENAYGACALFTSETPGGVDSWCLYQVDPKNTKNQYIFSGMHRTLTMGEMQLELLVPLHLISDGHLRDSMGSRMSLATSYACGLEDAESTIDALFQNFYQTSGLYKVTPSGAGFILSPVGHGSHLELEFAFEEHDDTFWFTISDVTEYEPEPVTELGVIWTPAAEGASPVNVAITGDDATTLSTMLINFEYGTGELELEYPYEITVGEEKYYLELMWKDNLWSARVEYNQQTAVLTTKAASIVAALLYNNALTSAASSDSPKPEGLEKRIDCMATTGDVNVRSDATTSSTALLVLPPDSPVAVIGKTGNWCQILFGDRVAYMSADYLKGVS